MTTFWRYKVYADFCAGSLGRVLKRHWGRRQRQFSAFSLSISSETLEMRPALLYSDTQSVVGFPVIPKYMTLNDLELLFRLKFCFRTGLSGFRLVTFENNCVKTNKDRHVLSVLAAQIFGRNCSFWQYKVCADNRAGSLEKRCQKTVGSLLNARLEHLFLAFRNN